MGAGGQQSLLRRSAASPVAREVRLPAVIGAARARLGWPPLPGRGPMGCEPWPGQRGLRPVTERAEGAQSPVMVAGGEPGFLRRSKLVARGILAAQRRGPGLRFMQVRLDPRSVVPVPDGAPALTLAMTYAA